MRTTGFGGYIPPKKEPGKDWPVEKLFKSRNITAAIPKGAGDLDWEVVSVLDQESLGACTLNGLGQQVRMDGRREDPESIPDLVARLLWYYCTRFFDNPDSVHTDTGADPKTAMKAALKWGLSPEKLWPYDISKFDQLATWKALQAAFDNRQPLEWYWIENDDLDAVTKVQLAIDANYAVGIGTGIDDRYGLWQPGDDPLEPPTNAKYMHYMVLDAYDDGRVRSLGSWSKDFGDNGRVWFSNKYVKYSLTSSLLVITKAPRIIT